MTPRESAGGGASYTAAANAGGGASYTAAASAGSGASYTAAASAGSGASYMAAASAGGSASYMAAINAGGAIAVNLYELRNLKSKAESLLEETLKRQSVDVISLARADAHEAMSRNSQYYVHNEAKAVLRICDELETARQRALADLRTMIHGLGKAIEGYPGMERELSSM